MSHPLITIPTPTYSTHRDMRLSMSVRHAWHIIQHMGGCVHRQGEVLGFPLLLCFCVVQASALPTADIRWHFHVQCNVTAPPWLPSQQQAACPAGRPIKNLLAQRPGQVR